VAVDMLAGPDGPDRHVLRANGSTLIKPGYISVYQEDTDDAKAIHRSIARKSRSLRPSL